MDVAASIQQVTEKIMLRAATHVHERTGMRNLCLAGGVARLNFGGLPRRRQNCILRPQPYGTSHGRL